MLPSQPAALLCANTVHFLLWLSVADNIFFTIAVTVSNIMLLPFHCSHHWLIVAFLGKNTIALLQLVDAFTVNASGLLLPL